MQQDWHAFRAASYSTARRILSCGAGASHNLPCTAWAYLNVHSCRCIARQLARLGDMWITLWCQQWLLISSSEKLRPEQVRLHASCQVCNTAPQWWHVQSTNCPPLPSSACLLDHENNSGLVRSTFYPWMTSPSHSNSILNLRR